MDELEPYNEDELDLDFPEESWNWDFCDDQFEMVENKMVLSEEEQRARGFFDEGAGPPDVSPEELTSLS